MEKSKKSDKIFTPFIYKLGTTMQRMKKVVNTKIVNKVQDRSGIIEEVKLRRKEVWVDTAERLSLYRHKDVEMKLMSLSVNAHKVLWWIIFRRVEKDLSYFTFLVDEAIEYTGISDQSVWRAMKELCDVGLIDKDTKKRYRYWFHPFIYQGKRTELWEEYQHRTDERNI